MSGQDGGGDSITVTLVSASTGQSESLPLSSSSTTVSDLLEWCRALFGLDGADKNNTRLMKDGKPLGPSSASLKDAGVKNGDLVAVQVGSSAPPPGPTSSSSATTTTASSGGGGGGGFFGGLDFSSLLGGAGAAAPSSSAAPDPPVTGDPVYFAGMSLNDAMEYNPHPRAIVSLLLSRDHLWKELRYYNASLANKIAGKSIDDAADVWRREMVFGGIQGALKASTKYHEERDMKRRLESNPDDASAKEYFAGKEREKLVQLQYQQMMQEYPESMGRVLMLYVEAKINGHSIQAFCDSGAQSTIMSKKLATECELMDYVDTRFAGTAVGVGTGKILGRIHIVQLQIGEYHFPCSLTVMDDPKPAPPSPSAGDAAAASSSSSGDRGAGVGGSEMPFLLGLDMMKRHTCSIDLERGVLKFRVGPGKYMETPFLHEKDLDVKKGGTKGFDANRANEELQQLMDQAEDKDDEKKKSSEGGEKMEEG